MKEVGKDGKLAKKKYNSFWFNCWRIKTFLYEAPKHSATMYEINKMFRKRRKDFIKDIEAYNKKYNAEHKIEDYYFFDAMEFREISPRKRERVVKYLENRGEITVKRLPEKHILTLTPTYIKERERGMKKLRKENPVFRESDKRLKKFERKFAKWKSKRAKDKKLKIRP